MKHTFTYFMGSTSEASDRVTKGDRTLPRPHAGVRACWKKAGGARRSCMLDSLVTF